MVASLSDIEISQFSLDEIPGFPYETYLEQLSIYAESESWFKGTMLENELGLVPSTGSAIDLYPLRINPLVGTVFKHAYTLFGEINDDGRPLVYPKLVSTKTGQEELMKTAENAINMTWFENNGRSLLMENGILSQVYGGCVFRITYVPKEDVKNGGWRQIPFRIERIHPKAFIGVPDAGDMFRLSRGWVVSEIDAEEAATWGYKNETRSNPMFVDAWTRTEHHMYINGKEVFTNLPDASKSMIDSTESIKNTFNLVPLVYIPHIRVGAFHGKNAIDNLKGLVKEINLRYADYGDAVNDDSHSVLAMKNVNGSPRTETVGDGIRVLNLGSNMNVTGNESAPDLQEVRKAKASTAMKELIDTLTDQYRRDSFVPAVADGEDEGSQRSALTLATRFWPLTSHTGMERTFFSDGLNVLENYLLQMMSRRQVAGITPEHLTLRIKQSWAPMLPRDREAEVQEWVSRIGSNLGSIDHMLELTRDIDDIPREKDLIIEWLEKLAKAQPQPSPFGGGSSNTNSTVQKTGKEKPAAKSATNEVKK